MGLLKGAVALSRFNVQGALPNNFWEWAGRQIAANAFMDIESAYEENSCGWVSAHDYFDTAFAYEVYNLNPYLVLGVRQDKRTLGAAVLRKYHRLELAKAREANPQAKLGKAERELLKEKARLGLLKRVPPQTYAWEMCWNTRSQQLWFTSANKAQLEQSQELFSRTFAPLTLGAQIPFVLAKSLLSSQQAQALEFLAPLD